MVKDTLNSRVDALNNNVIELKGIVANLVHVSETQGKLITGHIEQYYRDKQAQAEDRKTNWPVILGVAFGFFSVMSTLVIAGYLFVTLTIKTELSPLSAENKTSIQDRGEIRGSLRDVADNQYRNTADIKHLTAKLTEVETQFHDGDQVRNLEIAHTKTLLAIMWPKVNEGQTLPVFQFYPSIGQKQKPE